jgi:hypothetical protein
LKWLVGAVRVVSMGATSLIPAAASVSATPSAAPVVGASLKADAVMRDFHAALAAGDKATAQQIVKNFKKAHADPLDIAGRIYLGAMYLLLFFEEVGSYLSLLLFRTALNAVETEVATVAAYMEDLAATIQNWPPLQDQLYSLMRQLSALAPLPGLWPGH